MRRLLLSVLAISLFAAPAADAATVAIKPVKKCYRSGEKPTIAGIGFRPGGTVDVTSDGSSIGSAAVNAQGFFAGTLTVGLGSGERLRTYAATDPVNPGLTASTGVRVSAVTVTVNPQSGTPGRKIKVKARGFTTGKRLYAHVRRGTKYRRNLRVGKLRRACHKLKRTKRIIRKGAPNGTYLVQFDTKRKYSKQTKVRVRFNVTVFSIFGARASTAQSWTRIL
jgi:hypothetical protein